ncbi:MAG: hypothetical protein Q9227_002927 [Pyrenula ochraceoflavens]
MPRTILSLHSTPSAWHQDRYSRRPPSRAAASVAPQPTRKPPLPRSGSWAALLASAHDTYRRERATMTTEERVGEELDRRRSQKGEEAVEPLTADALRQFDRQTRGGAGAEYADTKGEGEDEEMVPSFGYAVAELAKSLEEARKTAKKAAKEAEELRRENAELANDRIEKVALQARLEQYEGYVAPEVHAKLKKGWEEWADAAEQKIERLESRLENFREETEQLQAEVGRKEDKIALLEEKVRGWTNPHERKVLDATIEMLRNQLSDLDYDKENDPTSAERLARIPNSPNVIKPSLGRLRTVR